MRYLLDTNHCVYLLNGVEKKPAVRSKAEQRVLEMIQNLQGESLYMTPVTLGELYYGAACSQHKNRNLKRIKWLAQMVSPLRLSQKVWQVFGDTKAALRKQGTPLSDFDLLIACTAKVNECVLVTNDKDFDLLPRSFRRVNWAG